MTSYDTTENAIAALTLLSQLVLGAVTLAVGHFRPSNPAWDWDFRHLSNGRTLVIACVICLCASLAIIIWETEKRDDDTFPWGDAIVGSAVVVAQMGAGIALLVADKKITEGV